MGGLFSGAAPAAAAQTTLQNQTAVNSAVAKLQAGQALPNSTPQLVSDAAQAAYLDLQRRRFQDRRQLQTVGAYLGAGSGRGSFLGNDTGGEKGYLSK